MKGYPILLAVLLIGSSLLACGGGGVDAGGGQGIPDTTPPMISSTSPDNGAAGVAVNAAISVTFSEAMDTATFNSSTFTAKVGSTTIPGNVSWSGTTATFTPTGNLAYSTTCTATVTTGVKDLAGNALANTYAWSFATQAQPPVGQTMGNVIPMPASVTPTAGRFILTAGASIYVEPGTAELQNIGRYLADKLRPSTGYSMVVLTTAGIPGNGNIHLTTVGADPALGEEGYVLTVTQNLVSVVAFQDAGLFRGIQTIRQLLPPVIENSTVQAGPFDLPAGTIRDYPRFAWRGAMLDVARHFYNVADVKRYIDLMAYYKMNRFHLHLTDDQGWRIMIGSWPNLATYGGSTKVGGGPGGYFTQADYSDIVTYARDRYITVVPEIDMPGHTNAALASYATLNCDGKSPPLYTGVNTGFSALCLSDNTIYTFVEDVVREISALTPGPYIHIGGDEAYTLNVSDYALFIDRVQSIVQSFGKQMIGWEEIAQGHLSSTTIAQHYWENNKAQGAVQQGARIVMSPASRAYLDMKYDSSTTLGQNWGGYIEVQDAYAWDPATLVTGVTETDILGVEAPLWTETIQTRADMDYMTFPRLAGYAEIGWSPAAGRSWDEYKLRLGAHGPRLTAMGVNFYRSSQIPWR